MGFEAFVKGLRSQDTGSSGPQPPLTQTALSHAITIRTASGIKVGRIQSWSPQMSRNIEPIFEVQANNTGEMIEQVPQTQTTSRISVERYELYNSHMGEAFGVPTINQGTGTSADTGSSNPIDLVNLTRQVKPFNVREVWRDPFGNIRAYVYVGCWFADLGITIASSDDRIVKSRATLAFTRRLRLN